MRSAVVRMADLDKAHLIIGAIKSRQKAIADSQALGERATRQIDAVLSALTDLDADERRGTAEAIVEVVTENETLARRLDLLQALGEVIHELADLGMSIEEIDREVDSVLSKRAAQQGTEW